MANDEMSISVMHPEVTEDIRMKVHAAMKRAMTEELAKNGLKNVAFFASGSVMGANALDSVVTPR